MTVWIVNPFDNLPTEGFRPQRYWPMAEAFARAGHRVVYWTSDFNHGTKEKRVERVEGVEGVEVVRIPTRPYKKNVCLARILSHRRLARDFERLSLSSLHPSLSSLHPPAPDLVIASTPPLGLCNAARRVAKRCGAKFVCDIQDAWPETFARLLPRGFKWMAAVLFAPMRRVARRLYREADLVTGVSARYADLSGRSDFYLAHLGIVGANPDGGGTPSLPRTAAPPHRLVYLGSLGEGYDLGTVIEAVARRDGLTLDIAGAGPREPALRADVAARKLEGRVRFRGYLGEAALGKLLAQSDVGVIPMRDDAWVGLPNKLCDYLKAGLPVVSSLAGECRDLLVRTGFGRAYARGDPDSLLRALDELPDVPVALPPELRAEDIYSRYVGKVASCVPSPRQDESRAKLSVIVPSLDGRVPETLRDQVAGRGDVELVVVTGVSPVGKARNEGLRRATGEYVAWVDADDEVTDGWLGDILAALTDGPDVVTIDAAQIGWAGRGDFVWGVRPGDASIERLRRDVYRDIRRPSVLWLQVTRRALWQGLSFDETVRIGEDYLLLPKLLLRAASCRYLPHGLYRHIRRETSLVSARTAALDASLADIWERRLAECPRAYRRSCRWGLCVSAYWVCRASALEPSAAGAQSRENAARCRRAIIRSFPSLLLEAVRFRDFAFPDRISWLIRFASAGVGCWAGQRWRRGRCRS